MDYGVGEPDRVGTITLPDGRKLRWAQWGPEDARPVLFFSGAAMGRSLGFGADALSRYGLRLIAVERPGLGASDPDPGRPLNDWARDIAQLAASLDLSDVGIVGFSQEAPFALACALSGLASAVSVVSGQDDLTYPAFGGSLDPDVATLLTAVAADPAGVEAAFARSDDAEMMWRLVTMSCSDVDLGVYTDPLFELAYKRALGEGFAQGAAGCARDLVLALSPWPFDVSDIQIPVDLWYGGHDISTVHSPDLGEHLARRIPTSCRQLVPEAGGSLLWTHADEILASFLSVGRR